MGSFIRNPKANPVLDDALHRAFGKGESVRFIQIGGNDGIIADPLYHHHVEETLAFEWGHIFEPIPDYYELLTANMSSFKYVTCHQLAVDDSDKPGWREFNYISLADVEKHALPRTATGIGSFSRDRNPLGGLGYSNEKFSLIQPHIRTTQVSTVPARLVVRCYGAANFLLTDCEGYDVEIIRAAFDGTGFRPKVLQFEAPRHSKELLQSTINDLGAIGYRVHPGKDIVCELA